MRFNRVAVATAAVLFVILLSRPFLALAQSSESPNQFSINQLDEQAEELVEEEKEILLKLKGHLLNGKSNTDEASAESTGRLEGKKVIVDLKKEKNLAAAEEDVVVVERTSSGRIMASANVAKIEVDAEDKRVKKYEQDMAVLKGNIAALEEKLNEQANFKGTIISLEEAVEQQSEAYQLVQSENGRLKKELAAVRFDLAEIRSDSEDREASLDYRAKEYSELRQEKERREIQLEQASEQLSELESRLSNQRADFEIIKKEKTGLKGRLSAAEVRSRDLMNQLSAKRKEVKKLETRVDRLFNLVQTRQHQIAGERNFELLAGELTVQQPTEYMPKATVMAERADLWTGPRVGDRVLTTVGRGMRLSVEHRVNDWYRVVTPSGTRGWIGSDVVAFGASSQSSPTDVLRIKGYDASISGEGY